MAEPNIISPPSDKIQKDARLQTRRITPELIAYIVQKIVQEIAPKRVILFGSCALEEANELSDLDLFIIQDSKQTNREVRRRIEQLLWGRSFGVDLIVRKPEEVERNISDDNPFYIHHILGRGRVLYERPASTPR